jgi:aspartate 1-decarboxylase
VIAFPNEVNPMVRRMLLGKIHRATVTGADLSYEGSISIDADLLAAAGVVNYQEVHVWNVTRGTRFVTYAIEGEAGSGTVCVNGAAAHLTDSGDIVIVAAFVDLEDAEARRHRPRTVHVDARNRIVSTRTEIPGPTLAARTRATG